MILFHTPSGAEHPLVRDKIVGARAPLLGEYAKGVNAVIELDGGGAVGVRETLAEAAKMIG